MRFESLKPKLPNEAEDNFKKIKDQLSEKFEEDIKLTYWIRTNSFTIKIIDFEHEVEKERKVMLNLAQTYHQDLRGDHSSLKISK